MKFHFAISFIVSTLLSTINCLYPKESLAREIKSLDGVWIFKICDQSNQDIGFINEWNKISLEDTGDVIPMPVPSSFNDITQNKTIRDYLGWSWYEKSFYVPQRWKNDYRILLRFGSAHYFTVVYVNGHHVMNHTGGHLPFEADVTKFLNFSSLNKITVALNNTLSHQTIPQGSKTFDTSGIYPPGFYRQNTEFDFFNYGGIHRSVVLYATPTVFIDDIDITTEIVNSTGYITYNIHTSSTLKLKPIETVCVISVLDKKGQVISTQNGCISKVKIRNAQLWWPYGMHEEPGYLYKLHVRIQWSEKCFDEYYQSFGIRTLQITKTELLINGKPIYFLGFGKHEDSNIRGKGFDLPLTLKDFNLIKWIGANSFRTSHYPYADEIMDQADEQGILVIDECPAARLKSFGGNLLQLHKDFLTELIARDKNHPSVVAWSVANEPSSAQHSSDSYFREIVAHVKSLDRTRPVTAAIFGDCTTDNLGKYLDYVMLNRYFSWYVETGSTEVIKPLLVNYMSKAYGVYKKPIMMSEYGGGAIVGLHMDPPFIFNEDYQTELIMQHHEAFDVLREKGFFIGEHIWNFADFLTQPRIKRPGGNKKGIFTRERQPKASARVLRHRYHKLMNLPIQGSLAYCPVVGNLNESLC